jgi:glycogen debranching enzyme
VVDEKRQYQEWGKHVTEKTGIIAAKKFLNEFHGRLSEEGFNEVFVDQMNPDIVAVTRHHPKKHETYVLVAHTAFGYPDPNAGPTYVRPLTFEGQLVEIVFEAEIHKKIGQPFDRPSGFKKDPNFINGLDEYEVITQSHIQLKDSKIFKTEATKVNLSTQLDFVNLKPGSVVVVK